MFATIAQLVEHPPCKRERIGSNPIRGSNASIAQLVEHSPLKRQVVGSYPTRGIFNGDFMITNIILGVILIVMFVFTVGAAFLASEEKQYRYDISVTDEHEIL